MLAALILLATAVPAWALEKAPERSDASATMMKEVARRAKAAKVKNDRYWQETIAAMAKTDRASFVPVEQKKEAYEDQPLPIGYEQTISDPYIVAVMTSLLKLKKSDRVLEIGTGSGYQAAILAALVHEVRTIEIVVPLAERAKETLGNLGYKNVSVLTGDGYDGWPDARPFDAIIVTAGAPYIPSPLIEQLKPGGRMVIPLGKGFWDEQLMLITKDDKGRIRQQSLGPVMFVDFTGKVRDKRSK